MDEVLVKLKELARKYPVTIIIPKARPFTEAEKKAYEDHMTDPNRFIDYIGLIGP